MSDASDSWAPCSVRLFHVDAFTGAGFSLLAPGGSLAGNPAAVCPLERWLSVATMQAIAAENALSETAFFVPAERGADFELRWFTPVLEVDLCGHATLASAAVVLGELEPGRSEVTFASRSGALRVSREGEELLALDFPARPPVLDGDEARPRLARALGREPVEVRGARGRDGGVAKWLCVFESEDEVRALVPDMEGLRGLEGASVIVTAPGERADFVSRFFAPAAGVPEDPVTGSAHCTLVPYWAERLGKSELHAFQVSPRGGELFCSDRGERVRIAGRTFLYLRGEARLRPARGERR